MKFNTHDRTPRLPLSRLNKVLLAISFASIYVPFALGAFACFYYAHSIVGGISMILIPLILTALALIPFSDIAKAYVKIDEDKIHVVDYYLFIRREQSFSFQDIISAELVQTSSFCLRGYRLNMAGLQYIVLKSANNKYLFKIACFPETRQIFEKFLTNHR